MKTMIGMVLSAIGLLVQIPVRADVTPGDIQIMARALSFLDQPLTGEVSAGVVYSPGNAQSFKDAQTVQRVLSGGLTVGGLTLTPVLIPIADIQNARVKLLFLTAGLEDQGRLAGEVSARLHIPCVTTDLAQVKGGVCALGVRSLPKVQIIVNSIAAANTHIAFSRVFRMMITEL